MELNIGTIFQTLLFCLVFILSVVYWYVSRNYEYWKKLGIPFEKPNLFLGNLQFIGRRSIWEFFDEIREKHGNKKYVGVFLSLKPALVVHKPELVKKILVKDYEHFQDRFLYTGYSDTLGSLNLFTVKNPIWSEMRQKLSPMFTTSRLKNVTDLMNINATQLVEKIQRDCVEKQKPIENKELFHMYTSETVSTTVFGLRTSVLKDEYSPLWTITCHMLKWSFMRGMEFTIIFLVPALANILRLKFFSQPATEYVKNLFWGVVEKRKQQGETNSKDLVSHLVNLKESLKLPAEANSELADNLMLAQAAVFILGSVETSSSTLTYAMHELAHHPEEQEKLYNEVNDGYNQCGKDVLDYDDLMKLNYLSACIFETLRKYPVVPYLDRLCNKKYKLDDDLTLEEGIPVLINVVALHYDERFFPNAKEWKPERMIEVNDNETLDYTYLPFGVGPHFCIGKRYGMMQVRAALAQIIRKYKLEPGPVPYNLVPDPYSVILAPKCGGHVRFVPRS